MCTGRCFLRVRYLQLELAVTIAADELPFVKATYNLEGDRALVLRYYEIYATLLTAAELQHFPILSAIWPKSCQV